jgi:hypothetical protein
MSDRHKKLLNHYRTLGGGAELELFQALYKCFQLDQRLKTTSGRSPSEDATEQRA